MLKRLVIEVGAERMFLLLLLLQLLFDVCEMVSLVSNRKLPSPPQTSSRPKNIFPAYECDLDLIV